MRNNCQCQKQLQGNRTPILIYLPYPAYILARRHQRPSIRNPRKLQGSGTHHFIPYPAVVRVLLSSFLLHTLPFLKTSKTSITYLTSSHWQDQKAVFSNNLLTRQGSIKTYRLVLVSLTRQVNTTHFFSFSNECSPFPSKPSPSCSGLLSAPPVLLL